MGAIQARIQQRKEQGEEEHTARVVRRLASLTKRMDSLNSSLTSFWSPAGTPAGTPTGGGVAAKLPSVRVVYSNGEKVRKAVKPREQNAAGDRLRSPECLNRLLEVRLRLAIPKEREDLKAALMQALGKAPPSASG